MLPTVDPEADLLADALELDPAALQRISREPLGKGLVAGYRLPGPEEVISYVDTSLLAVPAETGLALEGVARVWTHPADPHLPALPAAAFGHAVETLLARVGIPADAAPEIVAYRPGRRAVLRVPTADGLSWVKVVRPSRIERIVSAHTTLRAAGLPVPAVRGWSPEGLLILDAASGVPATETTWDAEALLGEIDGLRAALAAADLAGKARTSFLDRRDWYVRQLQNALPALTDEIVDVAALIAAEGTDAAPVTIHGDLHLGQLFLDPNTRAVTGLIDVDTAGRGPTVDDSAAFLGHIVASAALTGLGGDAARVWTLAQAAADRWGGDAGAAPLTAIHLLGHALAASHTGDQARAAGLLRVARTLVAPSRAERKRPLISAFEAA
ncbi:hypothetical protein [Microbacterium sp.]|uniref:hypothetical protein n=1 Tax=Microbacterium sp. TaxID=51671 RepID=UPI003735F343